MSAGSLPRRFRDRLWRSVHPSPSVGEVRAGQIALEALVRSSQPQMACRLGSVELALIRRIAMARRLGVAPSTAVKLGEVDAAAYNNAGIFPRNPEVAVAAADRIVEDLGQADIVLRWNNFGEEHLIRTTVPSAQRLPLRSLEPHLPGAHPWTAALRGRTVLVVHPFAATIRQQYQQRRELFADKNILPDFALETLPAVQSVGGNCVEHRDWLDALKSMESAVMASEAEIVLIAAGAYGLPLAAAAKRSGRRAIHWGGSLQLLFGIRGRRWDQRPEFSALYNEHWVRPAPDETPKAAEIVEDACYW